MRLKISTTLASALWERSCQLLARTLKSDKISQLQQSLFSSFGDSRLPQLVNRVFSILFPTEKTCSKTLHTTEQTFKKRVSQKFSSKELQVEEEADLVKSEMNTEWEEAFQLTPTQPPISGLVLGHIQSYLTFSDLFGLRQVSKSFNKHFKSSKDWKSKSEEVVQCWRLLKECRGLISGLKDWNKKLHAKRVNLWLTYYKLMAYLNPQQAKKQAEKEVQESHRHWVEENQFFLEILRIELLSDVAAAKETAKLMKDYRDRDCLSRNELSQSIALYEIVRIEALTDLAAAKKTASLIEDPRGRDSAFVYILEIEALSDLAAAKETANLIEDPSRKAEALYEIVKDHLHDLATAKETANLIKNAYYYKSKAFLEIVKIEVLSDLAAAKNTANLIKSSELKDETLLEIVKVEALTDLAAAKKTAGLIRNPDQRFKPLLIIAKLDPLHDLTAAKQTAILMDSAFKRDEALLEIVKIEVLSDLAAAKNTAIFIISKSNNALVEIVKIEALTELAAAEKRANLIQESSTKAQAFLEDEKSKLECNLALAFAKKRPRLIQKPSKAPLAIAQAKPLHDLIAARQIADTILDPYKKAQALLAIVEDWFLRLSIKTDVKKFKT